MNSMTVKSGPAQPVYAGVDTHKATHHSAVIDADGRLLADAEFVAGPTGDAQMLEWLARWKPTAIGVEQTGSYGAGLTRALHRGGHTVIEVNAPDPAVRAKAGKSDPIDALMAAQAVRTGRARTTPKDTTGIAESIRIIHLTRDNAVRTRTKALNQIQSILITAPDELRTQLDVNATARQIVATASRWRPDRTRLHEPTQTTKLALSSLARRIKDLDTEIADYDKVLTKLTAQAAPRLLARPQVGPIVAAQLITTLGGRELTDAQFARLCGIAPIPASSGKTNRMRLHRGGDRQANKAIHLVAIGRLRNHQPAIDYFQRRTTNGLSKTDTLRAMKRHISRELHGALKADLRPLDEL